MANEFIDLAREKYGVQRFVLFSQSPVDENAPGLVRSTATCVN